MADVERTTRTVVSDEDITAYMRTLMTAFLGDRNVDGEHVAWFRNQVDLSRAWSAYDGDVQCGTARTWPSSLRLPGLAEVPVSCLTNVTVLPTHTRRGHLNRLMRAHLEAAVDAGEVASLLVAAEWPIYGRYGYGPATTFAEWHVDALLADVRGEPVGEWEIVDDDVALDTAVEAVLAGHHAARSGSITRPDWFRRMVTGAERPPWRKPDGTATWVVHRDAGRADGIVGYTTKEEWAGMRPNGVATILDLVATTPVAERELWRYLVGIDLVATVKWNGDADSVLPHSLVDGRAARALAVWDHVWARILDVPAALTSRAYAGRDRLVLEVVDTFLDRGGRFALDAGLDGATCEPTDEAADVVLPIGALSGAWLGGTDLRLVAAGGGVVEETPGAVERLGALLRWHQAPFCVTDF